MLNLNYTHTSNSGSSAKSFIFTATEGQTIEQKIPNQAKQIINYTYLLSQEQDQFTYADIVNYIDTHHEGTFTTSKGGTERIVRYYSKLLQSAGIIAAI